MALFERVAIVGVGLIGGSVALALRRAGAVGEVLGSDRDAAALSRALSLGVIDRACTSGVDSDEAEVAAADLVLLAVPVGQMEEALSRLAPRLLPGTVVTDAGSTKQRVVEAARRQLGSALPRFVPGHPVAGTERSGVAAARADLFDGRAVVISPLPETAAAARARVEALWRACGAEVVVLDGAVHDRVFAAVSHLPHLLAFALVDELAGRPDAATLWAHAAGGFRDFTRIAGSSPEMWRDICADNREALLAELSAYQARLDRLRAALSAGDGATLDQMFSRASRARNAWAAGRRGGGSGGPTDS